ncbi:histidinol dehydrogenase [Campylobacter sp. CCUG 57310]|uniref:histidinol dehydrogenase n=1 Tax=Campylobacter sp. CCUG 57310 TaxID=2517362 RepID=UPI00156719AE|nr:histidinol dehydrogenase [Campylobacter sp. CCUG 57310]QKF92422.1 histidinal dehydrogenase / histidinol dehydrogenase [Campylobacter sp. CCUG 57310]
MKFLLTSDENFKDSFKQLVNRSDMDMGSVTPVVLEILNDVKKNGDAALFEQVGKFDRWKPNEADFKIDPVDMQRAYDGIDDSLRHALNLAYDRIKAYHEKSLPQTWTQKDDQGVLLGAKYTPVDRAGLYIPGGKAAYPSSLLMNAIPAIVAGVKQIVVCTPAVEGKVNKLLLAAMHICGIKEAYKVGGASAIAAMAYGTNLIKKVDVITGPGNIYVATAKKLVYGEVNIDMIAGPSEIGVIADESANPRHIAIDMLSQAEHDELASAFLITPNQAFAAQVQRCINEELKSLQRESIARASIENKSAIIVARDIKECVELMNELAVEHLEIATNDAMEIMSDIRHAGAIFIGHFTPEAMGDYLAGPNHTLPTGGSARFYSPLGVENFIKKSSIISVSAKGITELGQACMKLAEAEGLTAHKRSVEIRYNELTGIGL